MNERIVLIGAGSAVFTRGLVADLIRLGIKADLARRLCGGVESASVLDIRDLGQRRVKLP